MAASCADVQARLFDALDGRLDAADSMRFHAHLEGCAACRERVALWEAVTPRLRAAVPEGPDAMAIRRMQLQIERQLAQPPGRATPAPRWWGARRTIFASIVVIATAASLLALWRRPARRSGQVEAAYAALTRARGPITVGGRPLDRPGRTIPLSTGAPLALETGAEAELVLERGANLQVTGPARLSLQGAAADVAVHLDQGRLQVQVAHRLTGERFQVITPELQVEVRGTRFAVTAGAGRSHVEVTEGRVAVHFRDGRTVLLPAGQAVDSAAPDGAGAPPAPTGVTPPADQPAPTAALDCAEAERACRGTALSVRDSMRRQDAPRALRLLADGDRQARETTQRCGAGMTACRDELGYLHAEALNEAGRAADAIAAFRSLDRRGAPPAMRQNALYAAAQIERQRGWAGRARADYERALAAAPRGALAEEALVGAMESAHAAGDEGRARTLAGRYLRSFPSGLARDSANRLAGGAAP